MDNVKQEPLIANLPKAGKILSEKDSKKFGYKELTLSNGARVLLKKTNLKEGEVIMNASSKGGSSLYDLKDRVNLELFDAVIAYSGLGNFSSTELDKALAGKIATGDMFVGDSATKAAIEAKCAPDCVEMEGAAVSQIAAKNDVPCVILRAMSDNADEDGHEVLVVKKFSITEYVATATKIVAAMVESL